MFVGAGYTEEGCGNKEYIVTKETNGDRPLSFYVVYMIKRT